MEDIMATTSGTQTREAHVISAIRDVLTVLESETGDRQYALEVIAGLVDSAGPFVHVEVRDVYGNQLVYPASDTARIFTGLTGKKTFTPGDLDHIRRHIRRRQCVNICRRIRSIEQTSR